MEPLAQGLQEDLVGICYLIMLLPFYPRKPTTYTSIVCVAGARREPE